MAKAISASKPVQRIVTYVPDPIKDDLEKWASEEGRKMSNLVAYLLEKEVKDWRVRKEPEKQG